MRPSSFPIGQKVVCVDDCLHPHVFEYFDHVPVKGEIYTIGELFWVKQFNTSDWSLGIQVTELPPLPNTPPRVGFSLWRFRLLKDFKRLRQLHGDESASGSGQASSP